MLAGLALALAPAAADPTPPAGRPPFVPCPIVKVAPQPPAVASPVPQPDLSLPTIGGEGLGTKGLAVPEGEPPLPKNLSAPAWIVADLDTGAVVGACGPHERWAPASLEKLLLAATVLPKLDPNQVVTVTKEDLDFEPGSSSVGLLLGGKYPVRTLWLGLMLNSGNDAANVLARIGGGPEGVAGTMAAMNAEARRLGAFDTHAETPHGLDGPGQVTSVYDLALISRLLFNRADFRAYAGAQRAQIPPQPPRDKVGFQIQNDNRLLENYPGAMGGKTGFTDIARHNFVGAAQRDGRRLVVALLGAEHRPVRTWQQAAALLNWGFSTSRDASVGTLVQPGEAEQLFVRASASAAAAAPAPPAGDAAAGAPMPAGSVVKVGIVVVAALFATIWLIVLLWSWRRRAAASGP
jgi:D-alanyl-D-alanine carboxypeptidase (penicillin-binding protein 5/6)